MLTRGGFSLGNRAFTQLVADRQFAQLGLALIGVLAQVEAAIAPFVEAELDTDPADELDTTGVVRAVDTKADTSLALAGLGPSSDFGDDLGVAISRDELDDDDVLSRGKKPLHPPGPLSRKEDRGSIPKSENPKVESGFSRKGKDAEPRQTSSKDGKKVKKKKKKKGGDEFDDLFSSLV